MTYNINSIDLWEENPDTSRTSKIVRINFNFPCTWTTLSIEELKQIIRLWIKTEEQRYPLDYSKGRWLLFTEIADLFYEENDFKTADQIGEIKNE